MSSWPGKSAKRVFAPDVPAIHVSLCVDEKKTRMPGAEAGHDEEMGLAVGFGT
jgi:hypothetical protein